MTNCWICGSSADSAEHKIKRTDLVAIHGDREAFSCARLGYRKANGEVVALQGPSSAHVKYEKTLCTKCNSQLSQPWDRAYEQFVGYIDANENEILRRRQVCLRTVFEENAQRRQLDLFRYFSKAFGCRIADAKQEVPKDVLDVLKHENFQTALWVCFAVDENECKTSRSHKLAIGRLITNAGNRPFPRYATSMFRRWLVVSMWYGWGPYGPVGSRWSADVEFLHLGSYAPNEYRIKIPREGGTEILWPGFED